MQNERYILRNRSRLIWKSRMPLRKILRASYKILTTPFQVLEKIIILIKYKPIIEDYKKCIKKIEETKSSNLIDAKLVEALVIAEDHRNDLHYGVDYIAIARTLKLKITKNRTQGASTIEQQLVRTITQRYEKTPRRKIREQLLATMISKKFTKEKLCKSYLSIAHYGYKKRGSSGIKAITQENPKIRASEIISLLKYPGKSKPCELTKQRIYRRSHHIERLLSQPKRHLFLPNKIFIK